MSTLLAIIIGTFVFVPLGLVLQWWLPQDGPGELIVLLTSLPLVLVATTFIRYARKRSSSHGGLKIAGYCILTVFVWIQVFAFIPWLSRRIGPWVALRSMLVEATREIQAKREELGIPADRPLTPREFEILKALVRFRRSEYTFPFINKAVRLRWLSTAPPYVGLNYDHGRNCLFDLDSMRCTYID